MSSPVTVVFALIAVLSVGACSSGNQQGQLEWVAGLRPGDCVDPGTRASAAIVRMRVVPCRDRHAMEVYARLPYLPGKAGAATSTPSAPSSSTSSSSPSTSSPSTSPAGTSSASVSPRSTSPLTTPSLSTPSLPTLTATTAPAAAASSSEYPGRDVLRTFAREACAEHFRAYLGSSPREPWYFLTYLFPSVASWTMASAQRPKLGPLARLVTSSVRSDRAVVCFVRTTGPALTASVRDGVSTPTLAPATTNLGPAPAPAPATSKPVGAAGSPS